MVLFMLGTIWGSVGTAGLIILGHLWDNRWK
jgi:hypothetical protein